jgi:drug/metabolite transporter (DMT)-like permease
MMDRILGIILVVASAAGFGTLAIFGRYAYADGMDTLTILSLRFALATIPTLALLAIRRERFPRGSVLLRLIGMGVIGYVCAAFAYLVALKYASAGLVALLLYLYPIFVALIAVPLLHEPLTGAKGMALGLALTGTALAVGPLSGQAPGILLAIGSALLYAIYIIVGKDVMRHVSSVQSSAVIFITAGIVNGVLMMVTGPHLPVTGRGWAAITAMVVITTLLPVVAFLSGLKRIGPTNAAMLSTLEPVVTVLLASWWLNETLTPITLLGGGLILTAALLVIHGEVRRPPFMTGDQAVRSGQSGAIHPIASTTQPPSASESSSK